MQDVESAGSEKDPDDELPEYRRYADAREKRGAHLPGWEQDGHQQRELQSGRHVY
jgi:hypothetical protein